MTDIEELKQILEAGPPEIAQNYLLLAIVERLDDIMHEMRHPICITEGRYEPEVTGDE